jgi:ABC-type glycerol-3-phosphate transport system permease component
MVSKSFTPTTEILASPGSLIPSTFTIKNLLDVLNGWPFIRWLINSFIVTTGAVFVSLTVSLFAAFSFSRLQWRGRDVVFVIFLTSMFVPWEINAIPLYFITNKLGLLNTYPGIFLPISAMPIGLFLLRQFFINIPQEVEDAARMDGCGSLGVLLRVMVPMTAPALGALLIFIFLFTWNEFFWSLICLQRSKMLTLPIGLKIIMGAHNIEYGLLFGASFLAMVPSLIVFLVLRRRIIRGISIAGVTK